MPSHVLLGEMSIVGPRPHPIALNEAFAERISPLAVSGVSADNGSGLFWNISWKWMT